MANFKPYSASLLAIGGFLLVAMGIYFVFMRPALLPEDYKYIGTTSTILQENVPQLSVWLQKVFWVMGCYIFTTGLLTIFIALTTFRSRTSNAFIIVLISGISSIGFMTIVNFIIASDFKWVLLVFSLFWVVALILYKFRK
jgi:hypothetical protein